MERLLALGASTVLVASCSFGALDGLSGGANEADGGGVAEASASSSSGGTSTDGATEAEPATYCAAHGNPGLYCLDFESGGVPLGFSTSAAGATAVIDMQGRDGSKGFTSSVPSGNGDGAACISVQLASTRTALTLEADVRFSAVGAENYDILNLFTNDNRELGVSVTGTKIEIEEDRPNDGGISLDIVSDAVAKQTYQRLRFVIAVDGTVAHTELFADGVTVAKHDALGATVSAATTLQIGDCNLVGANGWTVHYDNVVVYETK